MRDTPPAPPSPFAALFAHLDWADRRTLGALRATPDPDAVRRLAHVLAAERVWLTRLRGEPQDTPIWPDLTLDECERLAADNRAGYAAYLAALTGAGVAREVDYVNSAGQAFRSRADDILLQVALHGQYHRGQIALLVRAAGGEPAPTDYVVFVRGAPPSAPAR